mgnify:CR=1 FL=1
MDVCSNTACTYGERKIFGSMVQLENGKWVLIWSCPCNNKTIKSKGKFRLYNCFCKWICGHLRQWVYFAILSVLYLFKKYVLYFVIFWCATYAKEFILPYYLCFIFVRNAFCILSYSDVQPKGKNERDLRVKYWPYGIDKY